MIHRTSTSKQEGEHTPSSARTRADTHTDRQAQAHKTGAHTHTHTHTHTRTSSVYKGAELISHVDLSKTSRFLAGRSREGPHVNLDLGTQNTISRHHAVVQHAYDG